MTVPAIHVLVIDDDAEQRRRLTQPFSAWGWAAVELPGEPRAALSSLSDGGLDLVLLDLRAAERGNFAFLRARRDDPALSATPVVITAWPGAPVGRLARCIELGAADYIIHTDHHVLLRARLQNVLQRKLLQEQANTALEAFNEVEKIADDLRLVILPIGAALSAETHYEQLIARIVAEAQSICNADGGALFLAQDDGLLHTDYVRVHSLDYTWQQAPGGPGVAAIPLTDPETGAPNHASLPVYVALAGNSVNLTDLRGGRFDTTHLLPVEGAAGYQPQTLLAVPLRSGQVVGTLLLADSRHPLSGEVVPFDAYHQQVAESLASQAAVVLNNRLLNERQAQLLRYKRELEIGREIQLSFLPSRLPALPGWEVVARFRPAQEVAGDFYDVFPLPHGHLVLAICDVVGKGVTAALFMAIIRSLFRALFQQYYFQAERVPAAPESGQAPPFPFVDREALLHAVRLTNAYLIANHGDTYTFATLFAGVLDPGGGRLLYVNAGHNPPLLLRSDGNDRRAVCQELSPTGPAIGLLPNPEFRLGEASVQPGDLLFAFTDGVIEARNPAADEFGQERLETLITSEDGPAEAVLAMVEAAVRDYTAGAEAFDDVTMLGVRRLAVDLS